MAAAATFDPPPLPSTPSSRRLPPGSPPGEPKVRMAVRLRPPNGRERKSPHGGSAWRVEDGRTLLQTAAAGPSDAAAGFRSFRFPHSPVFEAGCSNKEVYDGAVKGIVDDVLGGSDRTVCAYGQVASGKTYAMQGKGRIGEAGAVGGGIVHMAARDVFRWAEADEGRSVSVSYVEIFNEEVRDLLVDHPNAMPGDAPGKATVRVVDSVLVNETKKRAESFERLMEVLAEGEKHRQVAASTMNERSSRSHTFLKLILESAPLNSDIQSDEETAATSLSTPSLNSRGEAAPTSTLTLVDLAGYGTESVPDVAASSLVLRPKQPKKGGGKINESLLVLSRVVNSLGGTCDDRAPFRESKLTQLLKPALLGDDALAMVFCVSPSGMHLEETISTLKFAERAAQIRKAPTRTRLGSRDSVPAKGGSRRSLLALTPLTARLASRDCIPAPSTLSGSVSRASTPGAEGTPTRPPLADRDGNHGFAGFAVGTATPSKSRTSPNKRRSKLAAPSPYKRSALTTPAPRRTAFGRSVPPSPAFGRSVPPSPTSGGTAYALGLGIEVASLYESVAEKSARVAELEAALRDAEEKLKEQAGEMEALRAANRDLESRLSGGEGKGERTSLIDGKGSDVVGGYATFDDRREPNLNGRGFDKRVDRLLDMVGAAMDLAGESG